MGLTSSSPKPCFRKNPRRRKCLFRKIVKLFGIVKAYSSSNFRGGCDYNVAIGNLQIVLIYGTYFDIQVVLLLLCDINTVRISVHTVFPETVTSAMISSLCSTVSVASVGAEVVGWVALSGRVSVYLPIAPVV